VPIQGHPEEHYAYREISAEMTILGVAKFRLGTWQMHVLYIQYFMSTASKLDIKRKLGEHTF
jgi:hypothetical protein